MLKDRRIIITVSSCISCATRAGSLPELEAQLHIAERLGYADATSTAQVLTRVHEVGRILNGLIGSIREQIDVGT